MSIGHHRETPVGLNAFPPRDNDSEAGVVAACILDQSRIPDVAVILPDESAFFQSHLAALYRVILDLWASGKTVDAITVSTEAERVKIRFEDSACVGSDIHRLATENPLSWDAVAYALAVRRAANLREVITTADEIRREAYRAYDSPETLISDAIGRLTHLQSTRLAASTETPAQLTAGVFQRIMDRAQSGRPTGIVTPWAELNGATDGIQPTDLVIVAARPSMGKTAFGLNVCEHAAVDWDVPTLFISLEMSNSLLIERLLAARAGVNSMRMRTGAIGCDEWAVLSRAKAEVDNAPLRMVRRPGRILPEIIAEIRRAHGSRPLGLVVIDYLQLIRSENPRENENQALTRIMSDLKDINRRLEVPILALSQLNRASESREGKRPQMSDLRGSGSIEQDADVVLLLHRPDYYDACDQPGVAEVAMTKNRNGPVIEMRLTFEKQFLRFTNHDPNTGYIPPPAEYATAF